MTQTSLKCGLLTRLYLINSTNTNIMRKKATTKKKAYKKINNIKKAKNPESISSKLTCQMCDLVMILGQLHRKKTK